MMAAMDLTTFRTELTDVIDRLDETGPVQLLKYNDIVAEIRSATPEGERAYTLKVLRVLGYLNNLDVGLVDQLTAVGIDTLAALSELAEQHEQLTTSGVVFNGYPEQCLPASGKLTVDEALAHLYFGDDYPRDTEDPCAWFRACARLQQEAERRGMDTSLPCPNAYDENEPTFVALAVSSGHTPDSLVEFGIRALDQGVQLGRLADMLGSEPVPADVLAMDSYSEHYFEQLTGSGLTHAEAVAVFRMGLNARLAQEFTGAGVRAAKEIGELIESKLDVELAARAHRSGLTPGEWRTQVPKIQHLKYKGDGILPFSLLVEAAEEKVSLVRWDNNALNVEAERTNRHFYATREQRMGMYPWSHVYPDRILDLARAGISPSFIAAFGKLMAHHDHWGESGFADTAILAHSKGLTADMANAMCRSDSRKPKFSPAQLIAVLEEGLSDVGTAHFMADLFACPGTWVRELRERRELQLMTDTFVATVENTDAWKTVQAAAETMQKLIQLRVMRGEIYLKEIVGKFLAGKSLNDRELMILISKTAFAFGNRSYLPRQWLEKHEHNAEAVRRLAKSFDEMRKAPEA